MTRFNRATSLILPGGGGKAKEKKTAPRPEKSPWKKGKDLQGHKNHGQSLRGEDEHPITALRPEKGKRGGRSGEEEKRLPDLFKGMISDWLFK